MQNWSKLVFVLILCNSLIVTGEKKNPTLSFLRYRVVSARQVPFPGSPEGSPGNGTWLAGTTLSRRMTAWDSLIHNFHSMLWKRCYNHTLLARNISTRISTLFQTTPVSILFICIMHWSMDNSILNFIKSESFLMSTKCTTTTLALPFTWTPPNGKYTSVPLILIFIKKMKRTMRKRKKDATSLTIHCLRSLMFRGAVAYTLTLRYLQRINPRGWDMDTSEAIPEIWIPPRSFLSMTYSTRSKSAQSP